MPAIDATFETDSPVQSAYPPLVEAACCIRRIRCPEYLPKTSRRPTDDHCRTLALAGPEAFLVHHVKSPSRRLKQAHLIRPPRPPAALEEPRVLRHPPPDAGKPGLGREAGQPAPAPAGAGPPTQPARAAATGETAWPYRRRRPNRQQAAQRGGPCARSPIPMRRGGEAKAPFRFQSHGRRGLFTARTRPAPPATSRGSAPPGVPRRQGRVPGRRAAQIREPTLVWRCPVRLPCQSTTMVVASSDREPPQAS